MAQYATVSQLNGMYKQIEGEISNLISPLSIVRNKIKFAEGKKIGSLFVEPVVLTNEHGFSWGTPDAGAITLNASIAMTTKQAQVQGYQLVLRSSIPYDAISEGASSTQAFKKTILMISENMMDSATMVNEIDMIYGQTAGVLGQTSASTNASATSTVLTIAAASWAPGIWVGSEGAKIEIHDNTDDDLVSSSSDAIFVISSVDFANRKVTVTGTATGITALDTACSGTTENIYWYGSVSGTGVTFANSMMPGIKKALTNSGTLHNISAATYTAWTGSTYSAASGPLSFSKLMSATALGIGKGRLKGDVLCLTSVDSWMNLMTDQAALRRFDAKTKSASNGFDDIAFAYGTGVVEVVAHPCVKRGDAFLLPVADFKRIGARELALGAPGEEDMPFNRLADVSAVEARAYGNETVFCRAPNRGVYISTIVPA